MSIAIRMVAMLILQSHGALSAPKVVRRSGSYTQGESSTRTIRAHATVTPAQSNSNDNNAVRPTTRGIMSLNDISKDANACAYTDTESMAGINPSVGRSYAEFIEKHLAKEDTISGLNLISETEKTPGEDTAAWFWVGDNGKALEALTQSDYLGSESIRNLANKVSKFIMDSSKPEYGFVFRRRLLPDLRVASQNETHNLLYSGALSIHDDVHGLTKIGTRYHDDRGGDAPCTFGQHKVSGVFHGKDGARNFAAVLGADTLSESSLEKSESGFELTKTYVIPQSSDGSSLIRVTVLMVQRGIEPFMRLETSTTPVGGSVSDVIFDLQFGVRHDMSVKQVNPSWIAMSQTGKPYRDAEGVFIRLEHAGMFSGNAHASDDGFLSLEHKLEDMAQDETKQVALKLVVVGSHLFDHLDDLYSEIMIRDLETSDTLQGLDLSLSYDVGAAVNGVTAAYEADCHHAHIHGTTPEICTQSTLAWIRKMQEHYLDILMHDGNDFWSRGDSFLLLSCDRMLKQNGVNAGNDGLYKDCIERIAKTLLEDRGSHLDENGARALALIVAAKRSPDASFAAKAKQLAIEIVSRWQIEEKDANWNFASFDGPGAVDNGNWGFKAGIVARAAKSLLTILEPEDKDACQHAVSLIKSVRNYIHKCTVVHDDGTREIKSSLQSGETNSETQAWSILGVFDSE
jgi:hypothetical protein